MKYWRRFLHFLKLRRINQQIFLLTIIMITIPLIITSVIVYFTSVQSVKNEYEESSNLILNNLSFNISQYLSNIEAKTLAIYTESEFQDRLEKWINTDIEKNTFTNIQNEKYLGNFITSLHLSINNVASVRIYTDDRIFYSTIFQYAILQNKNLDYSDEYNRVLNEKGRTVLFGPHESLHSETTEGEFITIGRAVNKKGTRESLGVLFVDILIDGLRNILSLSEYSDRNFIILDGTNNVIYGSDETIIDKDMTLTANNQGLIKELQKDEGSFYTSIQNTESFINYVAIPDYDWKVIQYIDRNEMTNQAKQLRKIILIAVCISVVTAVLFMLILYRRVTEPIIDLSKQVEKVGKGYFHVELNSNRKDEFGILYQELKTMTQDLQDYIERSSVLKAQQKLAQYSALKSQIHPHFLANALETIQMHAILNDQNDISEMIGKLGELFRVSIQSGKELVTLSDELNHIRLYIDVQQMRFGDRIQYVEKLETESEWIPVLHFSIQPFIENAITHGLEPIVEGGRIELITKFVDKNMLIIIKDNGVGIDESTLDKIRDNLKTESSTLVEDNIGIKNVHNQIRYYFGKEYGIRIESRINKGTKVIMTIPKYKRLL